MQVKAKLNIAIKSGITMVERKVAQRKFVELSDKELEDSVKKEFNRQPFAKIVFDSLD